MMKTFRFLQASACLLFLLLLAACNPPLPNDARPEYPPTDQNSAQSPAADYDALLRKHVNRKGDIHYRGFQADSTILNAYLEYMAAIDPTAGSLAESQRLAFWINLYNASVIKMIIRDYPMGSIAEIGRPRDKIASLTLLRNFGPQTTALFDEPRIKAAGEILSLNDAKALITRTFGDPRVHFVLVDGVLSSPKLRRGLYAHADLSGQLDAAARDFFELPGKNFINPLNPQLSPLFRDYAADFGGEDSVATFVNTYSKVKILPNAAYRYLDYNWTLNGY